jgi:hypothetical protein
MRFVAKCPEIRKRSSTPWQLHTCTQLPIPAKLAPLYWLLSQDNGDHTMEELLQIPSWLLNGWFHLRKHEACWIKHHKGHCGLQKRLLNYNNIIWKKFEKSTIYCSLLLDIPEITIQIVLHVLRQNSFHINDNVNHHKCLIWGTQQSYEVLLHAWHTESDHMAKLFCRRL